MIAGDRQALIAKYKAGYDEVVRALAGIAADERDWRPAPGEWSAREVVHHLADSETISGVRLRRLLIEDNPVIQGYDEAAFAVRLRYNDRVDMAPALEAFRGARATTAQILEAMTDEDWQREGWHTDSGRYGAETWLAIYAVHAHNHAAQIRRLKDALR